MSFNCFPVSSPNSPASKTMADNPRIPSTPQSSGGRGKPLTMEEERSLVRIVRETLGHYDVKNHPKKCWIDISHALYNETGRSYSWQSCQRRITRMIEACRGYACHGESLEVFDKDMYRESQTMSVEASRDVDAWIRECDTDEKPRSELAERRAIAEEKKRQLQARMERLKQEREARMGKSKKPETQKQEVEAAELDESRKRKQDRVRKWLDCLPPVDKMQPGASWKTGEPALNEFFPSQRRGRSRSPRREENNYRQRSRSPRDAPPAQAADSAHPVKQLLDEVLGNDSEGTDSLEQDLTPEERAQWKRMRQSFPDAQKEQLKAAQHLAKTIDNAAMEFSADHMQPLFLSLLTFGPSAKLQTLDMVDPACLSMFRSISGITMEFFHAMAAQNKQS